jgi:mRNA interferase MazF
MGMPGRGEIWSVRFERSPETGATKNRPCVVLTTNIVNDRRRTVIVIPLSNSSHPTPPLLVSVHCEGRSAVAVIDQVRAVPKERLDKCLGKISASELAAVESAFKQIAELT